MLSVYCWAGSPFCGGGWLLGGTVRRSGIYARIGGYLSLCVGGGALSCSVSWVKWGLGDHFLGRWQSGRWPYAGLGLHYSVRPVRVRVLTLIRTDGIGGVWFGGHGSDGDTEGGGQVSWCFNDWPRACLRELG